MNRPVAIAAAAAAVVAAAVGGYLWLRSEPPEAPPREPGGSQVGALSPEPEGAGAGDPAAMLKEDSPGVAEVPAEPDGSPPAAQPSEPGGAVSADPAAASDAGPAGTRDTAGADPGASPPVVPEETLSEQASPAPAEGIADEADVAGVEPGSSPPEASPSVPGEAPSDEGTPAFADESAGAADVAGAEPGYSPPDSPPSVSDGVPPEAAASSLAGAPEVVTQDRDAPPSDPDGARSASAASAPTEITRAPERATPAGEPAFSSSPPPPPPSAAAPPSPDDTAIPNDDAAAALAAVEPGASRHDERPFPEGRAASPDVVAALERETAPPGQGGALQPPPPAGAAVLGEIAPPTPDDKDFAGSNAMRAPVLRWRAAREPEFETALAAPAAPAPIRPRAVREPAVALSRSPHELAVSAPPTVGVTPAAPAAEDAVADSTVAPAPVPPVHAAREPALAGAPVAPSAPRAAVEPDIVVATLDSSGAARPPTPAREARPGAGASAPVSPAPAAADETASPLSDIGPDAQDVSWRGEEPSGGAAPAPVVAIAYEESDIVFIGKTAPGALVEAWLDGRPVGSVTAGPTGNWRLASAGNEPGQRRLLVTATGSEGEVGRVESPIYIEDATRVSVTGGLKVVQVGSNLWRIAREVYGRGARNMAIYEANRDQIRNPDVIFPGQILILPGAPSEG